MNGEDFFIRPALEFNLEAPHRVVIAKIGDPAIYKDRIAPEDATSILSNFAASLASVNGRSGLPVFIGNRDHCNLGDSDFDRRAYGRVKGLKREGDDLVAEIQWNRRGRELIDEEAFACINSNFATRLISGVWRPSRLESLGLTNSENDTFQ